MFDKLKKAFGFGEINEPDELISDDPEAADIHKATSDGAHDSALSDENVKNLTADIFEQVVKQFNKALPDFLAKSVNPELEKQQLYEGLSEGVRQHIVNLENAVTTKVENSWRTEKEKLQTELKSVSKNAKDLESKRAELKSQQLSSERQKRAMTERIHDLEKQLLNLEAEKEQVELENKSMLNKIKVSQVYEKDVEEMKVIIDGLQEELKRKDSHATNGDEAKTSASDELNSQLLEKVSVLEKEKADADNKVRDLEREKEELNSQLAAHIKEKSEQSEKINYLEQIEQDYEQVIEKMDSLEEQFSKIDETVAAKDSVIEDLKKRLSGVEKERDSHKKSLNDKERELSDVKTELAQIKLELEKALNRPEAVAKEPRTIVFEKPEKDYSKSPSVSDKLNDRDDDLLNDTDWIVRTDAKPSPAKRIERQKSKKQNPRDDGQMSLW